MDMTNPSHPLNIANPANPASPIHNALRTSGSLTWVDGLLVLCVLVAGLYIIWMTDKNI